MRAWRSPEALVVDLGATREAVVTTLQAQVPDGPWQDLHEYLVLDRGGNVGRRCAVRTWSLDDELGMTAYAVLGSELRELQLSLWTSERPRVDRRESLVVGGLSEIPPGPDPAWDIIRRALAAT
jgi:hypothetical protein